MTLTETRVTHDWRVVAPWWHWPPAAGSDDASRASVRVSAPVFQKYDTPNLVNTFLADPQQRLQFLPDTDQVAVVTADGGFGKLPTRTLTGRRKLFLGSHHRHYLVACSLNCNAPGFPHAERSGVCEAGFVVRRRTVNASADQGDKTAQALRLYTAATRRRQGAEAQLAAAQQAGRGGALRLTGLDARVKSLSAIEQDSLGVLREWATQRAASRQLEGWVAQGIDSSGHVVPRPACAEHANPAGAAPIALARVGAWQPVSELPEELDEMTFPLYPLVAPPGQAGDATGETIYFGVVPTGSSDTDIGGEARFNDQCIYEIRCYVRRHRPECPVGGPHCRCPLVWSEPTAPYQLASHFDLQGTANHAVTVQLPDLGQLQADALRLGPGGTGGVRFQSPPNSALPFNSDNTDATQAGSNGSSQICSFSIPLITIVAMFVFKLFLPIVVFVFQLWFLLMLRFCIPPDVQIGGGLDAAFTALGPGLEIDASVALSLTSGQLGSDVEAAMKKMFDGTKDVNKKTMTERISGALSGGQLDVRSWAALVRGSLAQGPTAPPDRVFAPRVRRQDVVVP